MRMEITLEQTGWELEFLDREQVTRVTYVDFDVTATLSYVPARLGGTVETDHPDESECCDVEVEVHSATDEDGEMVPPAWLPFIQAELDSTDFSEELWKEFHERRHNPAD